MGIQSPLPLVGAAGNLLTSDGLKWSSLALQAIGIGQTWQNVLGSRAAGVTYTNTTGKPILILPVVSGSGYIWVQYFVNSVAVKVLNTGGAGYSQVGGTPLIVPNGSTYSISISSGSLNSWFELR